MCPSRHSLGVLWVTVCGDVVGVDSTDHLWRWLVCAYRGHVVGIGRVGVGHVWVFSLLFLVFAVFVGISVDARILFGEQ